MTVTKENLHLKDIQELFMKLAAQGVEVFFTEDGLKTLEAAFYEEEHLLIKALEFGNKAVGA